MATKTFDPTEYLVKLRGKDYLEVKWRLVWFRREHPDGYIRTEVLHYAPKSDSKPNAPYDPNAYALVKATVGWPGGGEATATKQEDPAGFGDYLEKAETGAIGRALGELGYGTQFTGDEFERATPDGAEKVVDSPVERRPTPAAEARAAIQAAPARPVADTDDPDGLLPSTIQQQQRIHILAKQVGWEGVSDEPSKLRAFLAEKFDGIESTKSLNRRDAQRLIKHLAQVGERKAATA